MSDSKKNGNTVIIIVFCLLFVCGVLGTIAFVMEMTQKKCSATPASEGFRIEKYAEISRSDCFRPGTCGFEKPYNNNTWCYTDKINDKWKACSIDTGINPWKDCSEYIGKPNATNISDKCLNALWNDTGCNGTYIDSNSSDTFRNWAKDRTVLEIIHDNNVWRGKGCGTKGIRNEEDVSADQIEKNLNTSIQMIANEIKTEAYESHTGEVSSGPTNTLKCINNIIKITDKADDKLKVSLDKSKDISTSEKDFKNFYPYILEIVNNYKEGVERLTGEYLKTGNTYEQAKQKAKDHAKNGLKNTYNKFKSKKVLNSVIGTSNISKFEEIIKKHTGVDVTKDTYQLGGKGGSSYIITTLARNNLLSIGQVYQLRKLMLEAFKNKSNHKFMHFYYNNFKPIADFLEQQGQLRKIVPGMLEVVDLSKQRQFNLAFEKWIVIAKQAHQICKDMKLDVSKTERKWDNLEELEMSGLPEPNELFVTDGFKKAIKSF